MRKNKDKNIKENQPLEQTPSNEQTGNVETPALADAADAVADEPSTTEVSNAENKPAVADSHARVYVDNEGEPLVQEQEEETLDKRQTDYADNDADDVEEYDEEDEEDDEGVRVDDDGRLDLVKIYKTLKKYWWMIALNCVIIGVIAALLIVEEPRTYQSSVSLAPESESSPTGGSLSSLASSFGIDIGSFSSSDAIRPDLYPDLVASSDFIFDLFKIPVKSLDGNIFTDYYTYMKKYQRSSWWRKDMQEFMRKFKDKPNDPKAIAAGGNGLSADGQPTSNVRLLSYDEQSILDAIKGAVTCTVDKQTFTVTINVIDQDPLICATVADSVRSKIQAFITDYRTKKATKDYNYYYKLLVQAKDEYEKACAAYAKYVDSHRDIILQAYISERDQLENNMQLKLNTYNAMLTQAQNAKAKIQEYTPAFTVLENAVVPVKPSGPKRMLFVLGFVFMTFIITSVMIVMKG